MSYINTVSEFDAALEAGPYAWPGGYPLYFVCGDGEPMSFESARENDDLIRSSIADGLEDGWRVIGVDVNWEDEGMVCAHSGKPIECAYTA